MGIQGFPTLKIIRPSKKPGKPSVEDYKGPRTAKGIVDAMIDKIPNHVKRLNDKDFDGWLKEDEGTAKAILFTEKGATTPMIRAIAIDFLGSVNVAQVRSKEKTIAEKYGVSDFPKLVLIPGADKEPVVYDGEMKKPAIVEFLSQIALPNPDPVPKAEKGGKPAKAEDRKKAASASAVFSRASASHEAADEQSAKTEQMSETIEDTASTESPDPIVADEDSPPPFVVPDGSPPMIPMLESDEQLRNSCLQPRSTTCVLALLPAKENKEDLLPESARDTLISLGEIQRKHMQRKTKLFPFYSVPADNVVAGILRSNLGLKADDSVEIVAINPRRNWWKQYAGSSFGPVEVEEWVDKIRMGEGEKKRLPEGLVPEEAEEQPVVEEPVIEVKAEETPEDIHDEL